MLFRSVAAAEGSGLDDQDLSWFVDNDVSKRLLSVPGLGAVKRVGGVTREVRVELDDQRMAALRVSALDMSRQLRNVQRESPGGRGDVSGAEQSVLLCEAGAPWVAQRVWAMPVKPSRRASRTCSSSSATREVLRARVSLPSRWTATPQES